MDVKGLGVFFARLPLLGGNTEMARCVFRLLSPGKCYRTLSTAPVFHAKEHLFLWRWVAKEAGLCLNAWRDHKGSNHSGISKVKQTWLLQDAAYSPRSASVKKAEEEQMLPHSVARGAPLPCWAAHLHAKPSWLAVATGGPACDLTLLCWCTPRVKDSMRETCPTESAAWRQLQTWPKANQRSEVLWPRSYRWVVAEKPDILTFTTSG